MVFAVLLSGGTGTRAGSARPKQYIEVDGRSVFSYSVEALLQSELIQAVQVVAASQWQAYITQQLEELNGLPKLRGFSMPGRNRQESIYNGLRDCASQLRENDVVLIHDAARPFLSIDLVNRCILALDGHDGVLPVLRMRDTVYLSQNGKSISALLQREKVFAGQAPELFLFGKYYSANQALLQNDEILRINGSTEPAILAGMDVIMISGDESNFKITTGADLRRFQEIHSKIGGADQ